MSTQSRLLLVLALGLPACGDKDAADSGATGGADGTTDGADAGGDGTDGDGDGTDAGSDGTDGADGDDRDVDAIQEACATGEDGTAEVFTAQVLTSAVTWTVDFDSTAEAAGQADCSYSRTFEGVQVLGFEHLCPDCSVIARGTATMNAEGADCYEALVGSPPDSLERTEWWGVTPEGGLHRTGADQAPLGELTTFTGTSGSGEPVEIGWSATYDAAEGGQLDLNAAGTLSWSEDPAIELTDPWGPRAEPYACGWECNDPGSLAGQNYDLDLGEVIPNVRLADQCGEVVDLHDFYGSYVILDSSQYDCGPCRSMAQTEEAFIMDMREAGIPVRVLTLMGDGLSNFYGSLTRTDWWVNDMVSPTRSSTTAGSPTASSPPTSSAPRARTWLAGLGRPRPRDARHRRRGRLQLLGRRPRDHRSDR